LEGIARAAGIPRASTVRTVEEFKAATRQAILGDGLQMIVAKVEPVGPEAFVTDLGLLENRFQFRRYIQSLARKISLKRRRCSSSPILGILSLFFRGLHARSPASNSSKN